MIDQETIDEEMIDEEMIDEEMIDQEMIEICSKKKKKRNLPEPKKIFQIY